VFGERTVGGTGSGGENVDGSKGSSRRTPTIGEDRAKLETGLDIYRNKTAMHNKTPAVILTRLIKQTRSKTWKITYLSPLFTILLPVLLGHPASDFIFYSIFVNRL
jgi:hypothetical protein